VNVVLCAVRGFVEHLVHGERRVAEDAVETVRVGPWHMGRFGEGVAGT
jgi:hypothetical protein